MNRENHVNKTVVINEQPLSVFSLRQKFHPDTQAPKTTDIISVNVNGLRKGIAVDRIEGKMQTILGDGSLALVLDPARLFQTIA
jgi:two-component system, chemotaxis family, sensor kinase CheA